MAVNETVGINLVADTKSLRGQLREAMMELAKLQNTAGASAGEIANAAKRAAELKDRIGDAKATIEAFDPDAKFKAFGQSIQGVAGAFAATQGALALVGVESAEVEKQLLKVQGALALSEGLNTVLSSIDGFKNLGLVIKTNVLSAFASMKAAAITAFTTMRGALIATGVGAFAVALGLIVSNFDAIKAAVLKAIPGLGNFGKIVGNLVDKVTDFVGITSEAERALDRFTKSSERRKEGLESELKVLEASGAGEKALSEKRKQIVNSDLNVLREKLKTNGKLSDEEAKKFRELKTDLVVIDTKYNKSIADANKKRNEEVASQNKQAREKQKAEDLKAKAEADKLAEDSAKAKERIAKEDEDFLNRNLSALDKELLETADKYQKLIDERKKYGLDTAIVETAREEEVAKIRKKYSDADQEAKNIKAGNDFENQQAETKGLIDESNRQIQALADKDLEKSNMQSLSFEERYAAITDREKLVSEMIFKSQDERTAFEKVNSEARKKIAKEEGNAKIAAASATADTLANLSNILGQETAAGKAMAVASATISAILSAQKAYESTIGIPIVGPVLAPINAGLALASGYKSIQNILAVQVPGQAGGGSSPNVGSAPSAGAGAPIEPRAAEPVPTSLDQKSLNSISNVVTRAYVVESDITGSQKRIERIEKASRF